MRSLLAASFVLLATALPAAAQTARVDDGLTIVALTESAQRDVPRDRLRLQLRVEQTGSDATRVQGEINRRMSSALEKARAVAQPGKLRVETGGYWIYQERPQDAPARWRGAQSLTLVGNETAVILPLAAQLQQEGFLMSQMGWELSIDARRKHEDELTTEAIERLRARSELIARAMNGALVRFSKIGVGSVGGERPPPMAMRAAPAPMGAGAAASAPVAAEPGIEQVQVNVQAEILVKPNP